MPKVVFTHKVIDIERWLMGKEERTAAFAPYGTDIRDYVAMDGSNEIAVTVDIHDMDGAQAMLASPPPIVAGQMESHGVLPPISAYIEK